uniref:KASH domain-containing protein n=2 Tax=Parascaris univalens TaxID=6257 RepID=A0A915B118_PARUN
MDDILKALRGDVVRMKDERNAENSLADAVQNVRQALTDAERNLEMIQLSAASIEMFKHGPLRLVAEEYAYLDDIVTQFVTPKIKQLYADKVMLKERLDDLNARTDEMFHDAKEQEELASTLKMKLDDIKEQSDTLLEKYANAQKLAIAAEDVNQLQVLLEQMPLSIETESISKLESHMEINKQIDSLKSSIKGLLMQLEKDVLKEEELVCDLNDTLTDFTFIENATASLDTTVEPAEQLENVARLDENLRQLKSKVEKVEEKLRAPEGLVVHAPLGDNLSVRLELLQESLERKKQEIGDGAKLRALAPEVALITECVQSRLNEIEELPLRSLEEQNATLQELEVKKQQLQTLIDSIPESVEGDELRERSLCQLGQLNDLLKRLASVVGDKFAAIAAFNVIKDEVQEQLSSLDAHQVRLDADSVQALNDSIGALKEKLISADKLTTKVEGVNDNELDDDKRSEKQALLQTIEEMKRRFQKEMEGAQEQLAHIVAKERMLADSEQLTHELTALIEEASKLLNDAEAIPNVYTSTAGSFATPLEHAHKLLEGVPQDEPQFSHFINLVHEAEHLQSQLTQRADIWREFVIERDTSTDQLEDIRRPLDDVETKSLRSVDEVRLDLDVLKNAKEELSKLRTTMIKLQSLSEQLDPLESAYADVRFFDVDVEQTQQQFEDLMSLIDNELGDENILIESAQQLQHELQRLESELIDDLSREHLDKIINDEVPPLEGQLALLQLKDDEARETRIHVDRNAQPAINSLRMQLAMIVNVGKEKLAETEKQERIVSIQLQLENLRSEHVDEEQLIKVQAQLQQLPLEDEITKALSAQLQEILAKKEEHEAVERALNEKLTGISQRLDVLDVDLKSNVEGGDRDQQIIFLRSIIDEFEQQILPHIDEISRDSQRNAIPLSELEFEHQKAQMLLSNYKETLDNKVEEKKNVEEILKQIVELDKKLLKAEEVLANESEMRHSDNSELLADNVKAAEELEHLLNNTLEQFNAFNLGVLSEEQRRDAEKKCEQTSCMQDRLHALCETLAPLLNSLHAWDTDKEILKSVTVTLTDEAQALTRSYTNNAQPYTAACNDVRKANDLLNRIKEIQQQTFNAINRLKTTLPERNSALDEANKVATELKTAHTIVDELLTPLTDDVNKQKELLDEQDKISARLNELSDHAVELLASAEDSKRAEIDEIRHQLDGVKQQLNDLQRKQEMPIRLVFHPEALKVDSLLNQLENIERVLSEKQEHLAAQLALVALTSTIARETTQLRDAIESAQKVEDDAHADINELQKAIDVLKNARSHLDALKDAYDQIEQSPDTDTLRTQTLDEQTTLSENYEAVERALEDRLDNLKHFNEDAAKFEMGLSQLDDIIREQGTPSAEMELSSIDSIIQRCNDLRPTLDQLAESVQSLSPLIEPASRVDALNIHQRETEHKLKALRDDVIRLKEEHDAENALAAAIDDLERTLTDAECGFEQTEASLTALQLFCDVPLRTVADKITLVDEIQSDIVTPKIEQLHQDKRALEERYTSLAERANEKFEEAKQQNELITDIDNKLNNIQKDADTLCNKYAIPQELSTAIEDVNRIEALLEQLPESSQISHITERQLQDQLSKRLDAIQLSLKGLLMPLEKDVLKEQELLRDIRSALSELTSTGDDVVAIDLEIEPNEQLDNVAHLGDNLRQLKGKVEKLERRLQSPEGLVKRTPLSDDLSVRIAQLQDALENMKQQLTDRAKLQTLAPEISLITESVQGRLEEIELSSPQSVDEQTAVLQDLESKKQQLESLIGNIPAGSEGDELRERSFWHLGQLNDLLGRLASAVGDKLAALAAFNATKDEVQAQLSLIDVPVKVCLESDSVQAINDRIGELNDKLSNAEKLSNKLGSIDEAELDNEKLAEKQTLLLAIEAAKHRIKDERDNAQQQLDRAIELEKTRAECEQLTADLAALVAEATKLLNDSEAVPTMFDITADAFVLPLEHAKQVLNNAPADDAQFIHLNALVSEAEDAHSALLHRADIWRQFVAERDSATDHLEAMRAPLDEIELRSHRPLDEVLHDLEALKELHLKWSAIKNLSPRLLSLSSELHPLFTALQDARLFASNVEIVERRLENLIDSMSAEFRVREELVRSLDMISHELRSIHAAFDGQRISVHQCLEIRQQLQGLRAHLTLLDEDIAKFNANRLYLIEEEEISTGRNFGRLQQIEESLKSVEAVEDQVGYDIEAAAEVLAAVFPDRDPRSIMREKGIPFDDLSSSDGCKSDLEVEVEEGATADVPLSPIPDDPAPARSQYERQRSRWRRILRTALPLQAMLVLLLGAACLVPHCDDEYCCQLLNNFARSFDPSLDFVNGPPPF